MSGTFPGQVPSKVTDAPTGSPNNVSKHSRSRARKTFAQVHAHLPTAYPQELVPDKSFLQLPDISKLQDAVNAAPDQHQQERAAERCRDGLLVRVSKVLNSASASVSAKSAFDAATQCLEVVQSRVTLLADHLNLHHVQERPTPSTSQPPQKEPSQEGCKEDRILGLIRWAHAKRGLPVQDFLREALCLNGTLQPLLHNRGPHGSEKSGKSAEIGTADHARLGYGAMLLGLVVTDGRVLELGWLLSELHTTSRFASAAVACLQVAKSKSSDIDEDNQVNVVTANLFLFWSEFCLSVFELLRGALEVWVPLRLTPHNCPVLWGVGAHGKQAHSAGSSSSPPAVIDIPSQAIKLCAKLAQMCGSVKLGSVKLDGSQADMRRRATLALLEANRIRMNWVNVVEGRGASHASPGSSGDSSDSEAPSEDTGASRPDKEAQQTDSPSTRKPVIVSKTWATDPIVGSTAVADVFIKSPGRRSGPHRHKPAKIPAQAAGLPVMEPPSFKSGESSGAMVRHVFAQALGREMLGALPCLCAFIRQATPRAQALAPPVPTRATESGFDATVKSGEVPMKDPAPLGTRSDDTWIRMFDFDGFIRKVKASPERLEVWKIQYAEPWVLDSRAVGCLPSGGGEGASEATVPRDVPFFQTLHKHVDAVLSLLQNGGGGTQASHLQLATTTVTALQKTLASEKVNRPNMPRHVPSVLRAVDREVRDMLDTCMLLHGSWDETHRWRGVSVAENLQWAGVRLAVLTTILISAASSNRRTQFRLPHSHLNPDFAAHLHAAAAAFRATHPAASAPELSARLDAFLSVPKVVLSCEQERTVLVTCDRVLSELARAEKSRRKGGADTPIRVLDVGELVAANIPVDWKRAVAARVQALCQERSWLLLQAQRDPRVLHAALRAVAFSKTPGDRRTARWARALGEEAVMAKALGDCVPPLMCPVLSVRYHDRGKLRPVRLQQCGCVMSWLAGTLALRQAECPREHCPHEAPPTALHEISMQDAAAATAPAAVTCQGQKRHYSETQPEQIAAVYQEEYRSPFSSPKHGDHLLHAFVASPLRIDRLRPPSPSPAFSCAGLDMHLCALTIDKPSYMPAFLESQSDLLCAESVRSAAAAWPPAGDTAERVALQTTVEITLPKDWHVDVLEAGVHAAYAEGHYPAFAAEAPTAPGITMSRHAEGQGQLCPVNSSAPVGGTAESWQARPRAWTTASEPWGRAGSVHDAATLRSPGALPQGQADMWQAGWFASVTPELLLGLQLILRAPDPVSHLPTV